jgi:hypothetical protein
VTLTLDHAAPSLTERQDLAMAERSAFLAVELVAGWSQGKGIYVAKNDFWLCGSGSASRSEKSACNRPAGINSRGHRPRDWPKWRARSMSPKPRGNNAAGSGTSFVLPVGTVVTATLSNSKASNWERNVTEIHGAPLSKKLTYCESTGTARPVSSRGPVPAESHAPTLKPVCPLTKFVRTRNRVSRSHRSDKPDWPA